MVNYGLDSTRGDAMRWDPLGVRFGGRERTRCLIFDHQVLRTDPISFGFGVQGAIS